MRLLILIVTALFSYGSLAINLNEPIRGRVLCTLKTPVYQGFEAVKVLAKDRPYVGVNTFGNLRINAEYRSQYASFKVSVSELDEDAIEQEPILRSETTLIAGDYWMSTTVHKDYILSLICNFVPEVR